MGAERELWLEGSEGARRAIGGSNPEGPAEAKQELLKAIKSGVQKASARRRRASQMEGKLASWRDDRVL